MRVRDPYARRFTVRWHRKVRPTIVTWVVPVDDRDRRRLGFYVRWWHLHVMVLWSRER